MKQSFINAILEIILMMLPSYNRTATIERLLWMAISYKIDKNKHIHYITIYLNTQMNIEFSTFEIISNNNVYIIKLYSKSTKFK